MNKDLKNLSKVREAIENAFIDISSLEVATLTNPLSNAIELGNAPNATETAATETTATETTTNNENVKQERITAGKVLDKIRGSLTDANLVAYTTYEIDGDSINFISQDKSMAELVKQHGELVKASIETRKAFFGSIVSTAKELLK